MEFQEGDWICEVNCIATPNKDLDVIVQKYLDEHFQYKHTVRHSLKQCALEWAEKSEAKSASEYLICSNDRDQWKARSEKAELLLTAIRNELS